VSASFDGLRPAFRMVIRQAVFDIWRGDMTYEAINFAKKFSLFHQQWQPKVIAEMNDYQFKIVKLGGRLHLARSQQYG
jgi:hypothetical protein